MISAHEISLLVLLALICINRIGHVENWNAYSFYLVQILIANFRVEAITVTVQA